jgi:hypothetical protein
LRQGFLLNSGEEHELYRKNRKMLFLNRQKIESKSRYGMDGHRNTEEILASCNGRNDADFVVGLNRGCRFLQKPDVFAVDENVYKTADRAFFIADSFLDAGECLFKVGDHFPYSGAFGLDEVQVIGEFPQRGGYENRGHKNFSKRGG